MRRIFFDMDGVLVDFDRYIRENNMTVEDAKYHPGAYLAMPEMEHAVESVRLLIAMGWECWIATRPPTGNPYSYTEKARWVAEHLPELANRVIVTPDKGMLGDEGDYLVDDRPHKANCHLFRGKLLHFGAGITWLDVVQFFRTREHELRDVA